MADKEGPQAPGPQGAHDPPAPQDPPYPQNPEIPLIPNAHQAPPALEASHLPAPYVPLLNCSHFKPKYSGNQMKMQKLTYLGQMMRYTHTHRFQDHVKIQRFCLTLTGEVRLQNGSLGLVNVDWLGLQNIFRQQSSKIGNTMEQHFDAQRSFHFNENAETIDA